jgi:3-hydroxyacyl-CoA dehydrogenase
MSLDDSIVSIAGVRQPIKKVCVIGAGTMGAGIAAHLANLGFDVTLLDATQQLAVDGLSKAKHAQPAPFYIPEKASEIRLGSTIEHLEWAAECDWICEAIIEKLDSKKLLYARLDPILSPTTFVTTNTSGLEIEMLCEGRSDHFRSHFVGAHFFNPPRYLKLLELIPTGDTDPAFLTSLHAFLERAVGRRVVIAKDTPGFIANRFGMWSMFHAIHVAEKLRLSVEEVDAITGAFLGRPSTATFRLNDIVGLDVMRDIAANLLERCPEDPQKAVLNQPESLFGLLARGWIGKKAGQGYYRKEGNEYLVLELQNFAYRPQREANLPGLTKVQDLPLGERIAAALKLKDEVGEFLRLYLIPVLRYAESLQAQISHSVQDFDRVMEWGFGWQMGPFKMLDAIGHEPFGLPPEPYYRDGLQKNVEGGYVPIRIEKEFAPIQAYPIVGSGDHYVLRDLGEGVEAVSITTKMGVITPDLVDELVELFESNKLNRFVLTSEAKSFSVGYDLRTFNTAIAEEQFDKILRSLIRLSYLGSLLEKRHGVAAVRGHALGGGFELAMSCPHIVADAESKIGLPETKVGLIPGGRGVAMTRTNNQFTAKRLCEVAGHLISGSVSANAEQARIFGYLRATDVTCHHPDRLISTARELALKATPLPRPAWTQAEGPLGGMIDRVIEQGKSKGELTDHDALIAQDIKQIYAKSTSFDDAVQRERERFLELCHKSFSQARIRHMLEHNRPLRN